MPMNKKDYQYLAYTLNWNSGNITRADYKKLINSLCQNFYKRDKQFNGKWFVECCNE